MSSARFVEIVERAEVRIQRGLYALAFVEDDPKIAGNGVPDLLDRLPNKEIDLAQQRRLFRSPPVRSSRQGGGVNPNGHPQTLVPAGRGNTLGVRHGVYSRSGRVLAPRAEEIADALMELPHAQPLDVLAAEEIGSLLATLEAVDRALGDGRVENKRGHTALARREGAALAAAARVAGRLRSNTRRPCGLGGKAGAWVRG
jgi:hypothetical protein